MKVGIITMHKVLNFGSVLQAYCTCEIIKRFGLKPEIINYMQPRHTVPGAIALISMQVFKGRSIWEFPVLLVFWVLKMMSYFIQRKQFDRFIKRYLPVSSGKFTSFEKLYRDPPQADIYLAGSDQIWNSEWNHGVDRAYFLDFVSPEKSRISYAASFGQEELKEPEKNKVRDLLKKYTAISVRESSGLQVISDLGITGGVHVVDPTLLLSHDEWVNEFTITAAPEGKAYLLIYSVERSLDKLVYDTARNIAESLGLRVVFLSQAAKLGSMAGCDSQRTFTNIPDFIRYFYHADYVVVSSFHGIAFSINFNKQFAAILPSKFDTRLRSLLNIVGLSNRIVEEGSNLNIFTKPIDYSAVNTILESERKKSLTFLESSLNTAATRSFL